MDNKLKTEFLTVLVGMVMIGISVIEAENLWMFNCKNAEGYCSSSTCERSYSCGDDTYILTGCYDGDPEICPQGVCCYHSNAKAFLESKGYCHSWYPSNGYTEEDFTKIAGYSNACRFQVQIYNNDWTGLNQGPEPNSQPAYFCNGNSYIYRTDNCETKAVEFWHNGDNGVQGC